MNQTLPAIGRFRMDSTINPCGTPPAVRDALAGPDRFPERDVLAGLLRQRLGALAGVPGSWVTLAEGISPLTVALAGLRAAQGPAVVFPPEDPDWIELIASATGEIVRLPRGNGFRLPVRPGREVIPRGGTAFVMSPNDPSGLLMRTQEVARLARQSALLVIDERHAAYSPRTMMPFVTEWENIVLTQTFETMAGLRMLPFAWAVAPPSITMRLREPLPRPERQTLIAAHAVLDDWAWVQRSVRHVMMERQRLFRQLRKLNMVDVPYPSWANYLLARFVRGDVDFWLPALRARGIDLWHPPQPNLRQHVRISGVSPDATQALKRALIELALELDPPR